VAPYFFEEKMKNIPKSVSKVKHRNIIEALKVWNKKPRNTNRARESYIREMEKLGWAAGGWGSYKKSLIKDSIVVKFAAYPNKADCVNEVQREFEQWKLVPREFKKHLPRLYVFQKGLLVQDRVMHYCLNGWACKCEEGIRSLFPVRDGQQNHGHTLKGTVKYFDWVYKRSWEKVSDPSIPFLE
jgi:hypothetical protein